MNKPTERRKKTTGSHKKGTQEDTEKIDERLAYETERRKTEGRQMDRKTGWTKTGKKQKSKGSDECRRQTNKKKTNRSGQTGR